MLIIRKWEKFFIYFVKRLWLCILGLFFNKNFHLFFPKEFQEQIKLFGYVPCVCFSYSFSFRFAFETLFILVNFILPLYPCCRGMKNKNEQKLFLFFANVDTGMERMFGKLHFALVRIKYAVCSGLRSLFVLGLGKFFSCAIESYLAGMAARLEMRTLSNSVACHIVARYACNIVAHKPALRLFSSHDKCCNVQLLNSFEFLGPWPVPGQLFVSFKQHIRDKSKVVL